MKKALATILFPIVLLIAYINFWYSSETTTKISIKNASGKEIQSLELVYANEKLPLKKIAPNETISQNITFTEDGDFDIKIIFSDTTILEKNNLGSISPEQGTKNSFIIREKEILFSQK